MKIIVNYIKQITDVSFVPVHEMFQRNYIKKKKNITKEDYIYYLSSHLLSKNTHEVVNLNSKDPII